MWDLIVSVPDHCLSFYFATQVLQNGTDNGKIGSHLVPPSQHSKYQPMPEITISVHGIIKLLCNLNPSKESGPDSIKPIVLKKSKQ